MSTEEAPIHGSTKPGRTLGLNQPRSAPALETINIKAMQEKEETGRPGSLETHVQIPIKKGGRLGRKRQEGECSAARKRSRSAAALGSGKLRCEEEEGLARGRRAGRQHGLAGGRVPVS